MKVVARVGDDLNLMTTGEVSRLFNVDSKTVSRWANAGLFTEYRTPGGHRRFDEKEVLAHLQPRRPEPVE
jgi:excisionase family DNA binding protein